MTGLSAEQAMKVWTNLVAFICLEVVALRASGLEVNVSYLSLDMDVLFGRMRDGLAFNTADTRPAFRGTALMREDKGALLSVP